MFKLPQLRLEKRTEIFTNALIAIVFAYYYSLLLDEIDVATFEVFRQFDSYSGSKDDVTDYIMKQLSPFIKLLDTETFQNGCNEWYPFLIDKKIDYWDNSGAYHFDVQIYIFHQNTGTLLDMYPSTFSPERRQLFLSGNLDNEHSIVKLNIISNLTNFFSCFGIFCFFCQKFFKGHGTQHKCLKVVCCFGCKRPFLKVGIYTNKITKKYFCDSALFPAVGIECRECNVRLFSPNCQKQHKQKCCRFGWLCKICEKYTFCSKFQRKPQNVKENHICGENPCHFCGKPRSKLHQCKLEIPKPTNFMTKLGFLDLQKPGTTVISCNQCYFKKDSNENESKHVTLCSSCSGSAEAEPNIAILLYESENRQSFDQAIFSCFQPPKEQSKCLVFDYLPEGFKPELQKSRTFFHQIQKNRINNETFAEKTGVVEQLLHFIFVRKLFNRTILCHDDKYCCILETILKSFLLHGINPKIVGNSRLWLVELPEIGVRFISSLNYLDGNVYDLSQKLNIPLIFFPQKWNQERFYKYVGKKPSQADYFDAEDSVFIVNEKKKVCK